jgi:peptidase S41-like protein
MLKTLAAALAALLLGATAAGAATPAAGRPLTPAELREDLRFAVDTIVRMHPDLAHAVDRAELDRAVAEVDAGLDRPMDQAAAWAALARLNPVLADGHLFIGLPDWRGETAKAVARGEAHFPFEVDLNPAGDPVIVSVLGGAPTPLAGARITAINGRPAREVSRQLVARAHGDTPAFRAALVSERWWLFYRKVYGAPAAFDLVLDGAPGPRRRTVPASPALPAMLQREASFERQFRFQLLPNHAALLTVAAFAWDDKPRYLAFTHDAFARMRAAGVTKLVIDVRDNGGGDDDMWKDGILRYIADRPYKQGSTYIKRVLKDSPSDGEVAGQIVTGTIATATQPPPDEPLRFKGQVHVLVGPRTYSSTVLFANVIQDYGFGKVAGVGGAVRTRQSGGVQSVKLPNSRLVLSYPRFVLSRPSGEVEPVLLSPDVPIKDGHLRPMAAVAAVLSR